MSATVSEWVVEVGAAEFERRFIQASFESLVVVEVLG